MRTPAFSNCAACTPACIPWRRASMRSALQPTSGKTRIASASSPWWMYAVDVHSLAPRRLASTVVTRKTPTSPCNGIEQGLYGPAAIFLTAWRSINPSARQRMNTFDFVMELRYSVAGQSPAIYPRRECLSTVIASAPTCERRPAAILQGTLNGMPVHLVMSMHLTCVNPSVRRCRRRPKHAAASEERWSAIRCTEGTARLRARHAAHPQRRWPTALEYSGVIGSPEAAS